jgi:replicative DNA helicase
MIYSSAATLGPITIKQIEERLKNYRSGITLPYEADGRKLFLPSSAITVVAAGTGQGKTSFMLNLLCECLKASESKRFYFLSYEEPAFIIAVKILMILSNHRFEDADNFNQFIDYFREKRFQITAETPQPLRTALKIFKDWTNDRLLYLCDSETTIGDLSTALHKQDERVEIGAVFVDYIQRVRLDQVQASLERYLQVKHVSQELLSVAKDVGCPVVVGAQFNRSQRSQSALDAIRESADIGHDASLVLALSRKQASATQGGTSDLRVSVEKNRYGPNGSIYNLKLNGPTFLISSQPKTHNTQASSTQTPTVMSGGAWSNFADVKAESFTDWQGTSSE